MKTMTTAAAQMVARIRANVDSMYADEIDHDTFHARQIALWSEANAAGIAEAVTEILAKRTTRN